MSDTSNEDRRGTSDVDQNASGVDQQTGDSRVDEQADVADAGLLETVVSVLTEPVPTLRRLTANPNVGWAVIVVAVVGLLSWMSTVAGFGAGPAQMQGAQPNLAQMRGPLLAAGVVAGPVFGIIGLAIGTAILHGVSLLLGGEGSFRGLFTGLGFAYVPSAFGVFGQLLPLVLGMAGALLGVIVNLGISIWAIALAVIAVRENNRFSTGRAIAVVLIPAAVAIVLFIVLMAVVFAALAGGGGFRP
ncbi:MAG: YIP1 family protein [Actinobacteria bacterium]|nr:YIP1 family protein [Actinomycetota bacterium]